MLEVNNLVKNYGKKEAVKNITFKIQPGEIYGFLGHNGAGKTTTIKACTGLLKPTSGAVKICGYDIVSQPLEAKNNFGYVPENPYLYNKLTGREFLSVVSDVYMKRKSNDTIRKINSLLEDLQLTNDADKLIGTYSHGMRRKITICAALLHNPSVIFLDEPTTGLDASSARAAKDLFRKYADEGSAVLFTTHVLEIAEKICDRIGIIYQGELLAEGSFDELKGKYNSFGSTLEDIFLGITESRKEV
ncbi:ABC transporter ATP-binding protein [Dethiobacter alkaliphilus]|uniref:ABC transporter ATP-binding protein n=1 Tax=Dethiobacter alkaliphilus TaxID=427926 RepID=UPI002226DF90|nr:ABC transporter ATP-binding protein [Dethiobacter alkaliphilus]MCW3489493.1 ABC transporter ATP-binding protein [Dethiobacter alkaliphilus]